MPGNKKRRAEKIREQAREQHDPLRVDLMPDEGYPIEEITISGESVTRIHARTPLWQVNRDALDPDDSCVGHIQGILGNRTDPWKYHAIFNLGQVLEFRVPCRTLHAATICLLGGEDKARERAGEELTV